MVNIHGGIIKATGGRGCPGIGTRRTCSNAVTNIYGGTITATGDGGSAGIGGGMECKNIGSINIYGGTITATGGTAWASKSSAGIGGGEFNCPGTIRIYGGDIQATGKKQGAGIGCGERDMDHDFGWDFEGRLTIEIHGGTVIAHGDDYAAGIGGGDGVGGHNVTISGGNVKAYGGEDAAGIGGGEGARGGKVTITGGYVYAKGSYYGAGIGGGEDGDGANVTITGGTVHASAGSGETGNRAIGPGYGSDNYGSLTVGNLMMVRSERLATVAERKNMCWYRTDVHVEPCTHQDHTYIWSGTKKNDTHTQQCQYCATPFEAEQHTFESGICTVCGVKLNIGTGIEKTSDVRGEMSNIWYSLDGRRLNGKPTQRGMYINNGRKTVIK